MSVQNINEHILLDDFLTIEITLIDDGDHCGTIVLDYVWNNADVTISGHRPL